ncbi:GNAT family N-acetyltransferase [Rhizobacter fulvus]
MATCRILSPAGALRAGHRYTNLEFDLTPIEDLLPHSLEMGRVCIHREWRVGIGAASERLDTCAVPRPHRPGRRVCRRPDPELSPQLRPSGTQGQERMGREQQFASRHASDDGLQSSTSRATRACARRRRRPGSWPTSARTDRSPLTFAGPEPCRRGCAPEGWRFHACAARNLRQLRQLRHRSHASSRAQPAPSRARVRAGSEPELSVTNTRLPGCRCQRR